MENQQQQIAGTAAAFANISGRATVASNMNRLAIAQQNIRAAEDQIQMQETVARRDIARSLAQFQGQQAAARAFRGAGTGDLGSGAAVSDAATAQAADQAAIVEANASVQRVAAVAQNQFIPDDPMLAAIQGGIEGMNLGLQISQALLSEAELGSSQFSRAQNVLGPGGLPVFENTIRTFLDVPGLDLEDLFGDFNLT